MPSVTGSRVVSDRKNPATPDRKIPAGKTRPGYRSQVAGSFRTHPFAIYMCEGVCPFRRQFVPLPTAPFQHLHGPYPTLRGCRAGGQHRAA